MADAILTLDRVSMSYPVKSGPFGRVTGRTLVLDEVDVELREGEVLGLLGESGSGKSTLGRVMLGLLQPARGVVRYRGRALTDMTSAERAAFRRKAQLIFQNPLSALNPMMSVEQLVTEPLRIQGALKPSAMRETARRLLAGVALDPELAARRPAQLSGGQRQRLVIARALCIDPDLVVADEPVSALDVSVQAQILELLTELRQSMRLTMLFISHDIAVVRYVADRIAVMYRGVIVEIAPAAELIANPRHPYTRALLASSPDFQRAGDDKPETPVAGAPRASQDGCVFEHRCAHVTPNCRGATFRLRAVSPDHGHACVRDW